MGPREGLEKNFLGWLSLSIFSGPFINYAIIRPLGTWSKRLNLPSSSGRHIVLVLTGLNTIRNVVITIMRPLNACEDVVCRQLKDY